MFSNVNQLNSKIAMMECDHPPQKNWQVQPHIILNYFMGENLLNQQSKCHVSMPTEPDILCSCWSGRGQPDTSGKGAVNHPTSDEVRRKNSGYTDNNSNLNREYVMVYDDDKLF